MEGRFHDKLKRKIHEFVTYAYDLAGQFPVEERYGLRSQFTRAAMSVMLNYVEGYARRREKVKRQFYEISHGSSQECEYIIYFAYTREWISKQQYERGLSIIDEIGKMLWSTIDILEKKIESDV